MIKIDAAVISGMIDHAKKDAPIEACGYLAEKDGVIVRQYRLKNTDASKEHFSLDPEEQFEAVRGMQKNGFKLAGVYHSHPATPARPSQEDIKMAYDPDLSYVIVSLVDGKESFNSFRIQNNRVVSEKIKIVDKKHAIPQFDTSP